MSLTDTDKSGDSRSQPTINADDGMSIGSIKAHATTGIAYRSEDTRTAPRVIEKDDQIIIHDGTNNKGLFGRDGAGNFVVKIAQDGFDVLTATDAQLIFNSAQNIFKIVATDTATIPLCAAAISGSSASSFVTVNTGVATTEALSYLVFGENAIGDITPFPITATVAGPTFGGYVGREFSSSGFVSGGTMRLTIGVTNYLGSTVAASTVRYYVFQETAAS